MASTQPFHWQYDDLNDDDDFQIRGHTLLYVVVLFSIILVLTSFFYLCTRSRWAVIGDRFSSGDLSFSGNSVPLSSSQPHGLDAATINSLPITIHHQAQMGDDHECSICLGVLEQGEKVKVLPSCCHCYHCECVDKWLITHSTCPICRTSVRVDSPPV